MKYLRHFICNRRNGNERRTIFSLDASFHHHRRLLIKRRNNLLSRLLGIS